ncbi:MAG TPA: POTRA domain-containing protein [Gemmata sp.]
MRARLLFVSFGLLVGACGAGAEPPVPPPPLPAPEELLRPNARPPAPKSVDLLIRELEQLRTQKAELEKHERELLTALRARLQEQANQLQKLGVAQPAPAPSEPDRVGRIIIEGNAKTSDRKILAQVDLRPGQILRYPALEEARAKLEKAGFRGATVEALPNEFDSSFKDIRVRIIEKGR